MYLVETNPVQPPLIQNAIDLTHMQNKLHLWRVRNFPDADATQQLLGVAEETGELSHAHLKQMQGIRGDDKLHEAEARDAVGDLAIYLMGYCSYRGWSLEDILFDTTAHVLKRDWIKDPLEGNSVATEVLLEMDEDV